MDVQALSQLTLQAALAIAVIALWRENRRLLDIIISYQKSADAQREAMIQKLQDVGARLGLPKDQ